MAVYYHPPRLLACALIQLLLPPCLQPVATSPELYPDLVAAGCVPTLLALLHHENGDIAADTIELLSELTDADAVEDSEAEAAVLVEALMEAGLLEALAQRLAVLDEVSGSFCLSSSFGGER